MPIAWITSKQLGYMIFRSERAVRNLAKEGIIPRGPRGKYDMIECCRANSQYNDAQKAGGGSSTLTDERTKLARINVGLKQIDLDLRKGELINTSAAMHLWGAVVSKSRTKILGIPTKLAPLVISCKTPGEVKKITEKFLKEVLSEISNPDLEKFSRMESRKDDSPDVEATTKHKRKRVGRSKKVSKPGVGGRTRKIL